MKIIVTGATGFVGANLCRHFIAQGQNVVALTGATRADWRLPAEGKLLTKLHVDLSSETAVRDFITRTQPTVWINCAAYGAYPNQTDSARIHRICFDAVRWMLDSLKQVSGFKAFIQMGSQSEYGLNCTAPTEASATVPDSEYAVAKVAATAATQFYGKKHGLPAWVFRLYSVYGPFEDPSRLILKLLLQAREGRLPPLANPEISRDFIHVYDVCRAVDAVLARADRLERGEVYNIGTGECTTLETLIELARKTFGIRAEPSWGSMPDRRWDHADWYANPAKAQRDLGWAAALRLREGLEKTMNWVEAHPELIKQSLQLSVTS